MPKPVRFLIVPALAALLATGCYQARWTPEKVMPPSSLDMALAEALKAKDDGRGTLPNDAATTLTVTRDGAIITALARNRSLAVERFAPGIAATDIDTERAAFDPTLLATLSRGQTKTLNSSASNQTTTNKYTDATAKLTETLPTGTTVFLSGELDQSKTDDSVTNNTATGSTGITQSLLRGFGSDVNLVALRQAKNSAAISEHELRGTVLDLVEQVENAYWDLVLAKETVEIRKFAVRLADEQLVRNKDMIEVGYSSPDAIYSVEASKASAESDLVAAEAAVKTKTIALIRLLNPETAAQWSIQFDLKDLPNIAGIELNAELSARLSKMYKPELAEARLKLANKDLQVVQTKNGLLPKLDASITYGRLGYATSAGKSVSRLDRDKYSNYEAGLSFEMAPLNRSEQAAHRNAVFSQKQAEASVANEEQLLETDVRKAVEDVIEQRESIPSKQKAVKNYEEALKAEQTKFSLGKSTNYDVLTANNNLVSAQLNEVTARVDYIEAITALYYAEGTLLERRGVGTKIK